MKKSQNDAEARRYAVQTLIEAARNAKESGLSEMYTFAMELVDLITETDIKKRAQVVKVGGETVISAPTGRELARLRTQYCFDDE
jgi:hypothetical protein